MSYEIVVVFFISNCLVVDLLNKFERHIVMKFVPTIFYKPKNRKKTFLEA